jgi:hypothetical protein
MDLEAVFIQFTFGLPAIFLSAAFSMAGLLTRKPLLIFIGALFAIGPSYYLGGGSLLSALVIPLLLAGASFATYKKKIRWAWILFAPLALGVLYMIFLYAFAFFQNTRAG